MCGIIGYTGHRPAVPVVMEGLGRLEYRGYDSAGVAWQAQGSIQALKASGKLRELADRLATMPLITATCAMGHTRWATHGSPSERNAHPHFANDRRLAIVHNGIIENYDELKRKLRSFGYEFHSDTDTEVLANLISWHAQKNPDMTRAFAAALREAKGAYAVCALVADEPGVLYAARMAAPLIYGKGVGESFVASDIPAFLPWTRDVVFLEDGEIIRATSSGWRIYDLKDLAPVEREAQTIQWDMQAAQKDGYKHFMLKEIFEQPKVIRDGLMGRFVNGKACLPELDNLPQPRRLRIVACGTSYHSGLWASYLLEPLAGLPCQVEIASEYRYRDVAADEGEVAIFISQSGETADTLAALKKARSMGVPTIGLCNMVGSSVAREADAAIFTQAGPEISVASTKAMTSQMLALVIMALYYGGRSGHLPEARAVDLAAGLAKLPAILDDNLPEMRQRARDLAREFALAKNFFYLGRGHCWPLALEGALKLKELSYIYAEGYAAGEMKHGPIALVDPTLPVFALALNDALYPKMKSNIEEVKARQGKILALVSAPREDGEDAGYDPAHDLDVDHLWQIPYMPEPLSAFVALPCLQLFSYEVADFLGKDVDQPRNLAKSVTVE